jgi:hypothetical protein
MEATISTSTSTSCTRSSLIHLFILL